jgi:hypothetical protein
MLIMVMVAGLKLKYQIIFILIGTIIIGCSPIRVLREFQDPAHLNTAKILNKNVKIHMKDGCLYVLDSLIKNDIPDTVSGYGLCYNQYREVTRHNIMPSGVRIAPAFKIPLSDVALIETNEVKGVNWSVLSMALIGVPTAIISVYCIINPKACFGSCPTFYAWDGEDTILMAEGFSSSILKSFEKKDIDMLYWTKVTGNDFHLRLTNEALETHIIKYADLLVFPRTGNERVFATGDGKFYKTTDFRSPSTCIAPEGDCREAIKEMDHRERYSATDSSNLIKREFIEMNFDSVPGGKLGLIIGCRQTFLTTYLFYQSLSYLGSSAGYFAARIESGDKALQKRINKVWELLGGIEVFVQNSKGDWIKTGDIEEMGPIASDVHLVELPQFVTKNLKVKLRLAKGLWRIDYLALAKLEQQVDPIEIKPSSVIKENTTATVPESQLSDTLKPLITLPGDVFNLSYNLPGISKDYEVFLCSKGYYIEWMRETWLEEENHGKAGLFFGLPRLYMKTAAADFKKFEPKMEDNFWRSRYVKKN